MCEMNRLSGITLVFALACLSARVVQAKPRIEPREKWSAVFGESKVTFAFDVHVDEAIDGRVLWNFSANQRTISRGEIELTAAPNKLAEIVVPLQIPPVKEGVIFRANLTLFLHGEDDSRGIATLDKPIWIYAENPFAGRTNNDVLDGKIRPEAPPAQLYDLGQDPYQAQNVYAQHPTTVRELSGMLEDYRARIPPGPPLGWINLKQ